MSKEKAEVLSTVRSILWMIQKVRVEGQFAYEDWANEFREEGVRMESRDDRKFGHHLSFFRNEVLPVLQGDRNTGLKADRGIYKLEQTLDEGAFDALPDSEGLNFLPFFHGLNRSHSILPFPGTKTEAELVESFDLNTKSRGSILYKNKYQWRLNTDFLKTFLTAVEEETQLFIRPGPGRKNCHITPLFVINYDGAWYLLGVRGSLLQYNLSRIEGLEATNIPAEKISRKTKEALRASISSIFGIYLNMENWKSPPEGETVTVRYRGGAKGYAQERFDPKYHLPGDTWFKTELQGEWIEVTVKVYPTGNDPFGEIVAEVLRWGAEAEAMSPPAFRNAWIKSLRELAGLVAKIDEEILKP